MNINAFYRKLVLPLSAVSLCSCASTKPKSKPISKAPTEGEGASHKSKIGDVEQFLYGRFVVSATSGRRVVLRQLNSGNERSEVRIMLDNPQGAVLSQGAVIERQRGEGFIVNEVNRSEDGLLNIYVRERDLGRVH